MATKCKGKIIEMENPCYHCREGVVAECGQCKFASELWARDIEALTVDVPMKSVKSMKIKDTRRLWKLLCKFYDTFELVLEKEEKESFEVAISVVGGFIKEG